jgi:D-sedoheptulose 7-phosphate isomerase
LRGAEAAEAAFEAAIALHQRVRDAGLAAAVAAAGAISRSLRQGGQVLAFGNGGSAADAAHTAAELVGRFMRERGGYRAIALTADPSVVTSIANDYGFERVFARQIEAFGRPEDVALAITTSGESPNVLEALRAARDRKLTTIALTGRDGGPAGRLADVHVNVPSTTTPRIQEVHRTLLHVICDLVETELAAHAPEGLA